MGSQLTTFCEKQVSRTYLPVSEKRKCLHVEFKSSRRSAILVGPDSSQDHVAQASRLESRTGLGQGTSSQGNITATCRTAHVKSPREELVMV
jgi:hypothetical protein